MKAFINFITTIILTIIVSLLILFVSSNILIPKWIDHDGNMMSFIIKGFYQEPKNSLDIVFMGNSDVYRGVSPMALYEKTGITSYNFVSAAQRMWIAYPMLEDVVRTQNPKIIFFNVDSFFYTSQGTIGSYSKVYDNMPLSKAKIKGVYDPKYEINDNKIEHIFPIFAYHSRYGELTEDDFKYAFYNYSNPTKGMDLVAVKKPYEGGNSYMSNYDKSPATIPEKNIEYLDKMNETCKKNGIELILMELPSADSWNMAKHEAVSQYAEARELKFIDLNLDSTIEKMNFNWKEDTSDGGDHLNIYGAEKVTTYLAGYLTSNYDFTSHKDDKKYSKWNEQYKEYLNIIEKEKNDAEK